MEEGLLGIHAKRVLSDGSYRAASQTYGGSMSKLASRPRPSGASTTTSKFSGAPTPPKVRQSESSSQGVEEHVLNVEILTIYLSSVLSMLSELQIIRLHLRVMKM